MALGFALSAPVPEVASAYLGGMPATETLDYSLTWNGIHAGTSRLSFFTEGSTHRIVSTARSADFISLFYEVDDRVESSFSKGSFTPVRYRIKLREGRHRRDKEVLFFQNGDGKTLYIDHRKKETKEFDVPQDSLDPLSGFYLLRTLPLEVGKTVRLKVFDSKRVLEMEVHVLRKEKVDTWLGSFDTIVVKPVMQSEGIFAKKGDIYVWLTDDERRIPVLLESEVAVGSIKATIKNISYSPGILKTASK
jgi:hypothetical protein